MGNASVVVVVEISNKLLCERIPSMSSEPYLRV